MIVALLILTWGLGLQVKNAPQESIRQHMEMAQRFLAAGKAKAAAREFQAVLAIDSSNLDARVDLGVLAFFHHDCATAVPNFKTALRLQPSLYKERALLGICEKQQGLFANAAADLKESLPHLHDSKVSMLVATNLAETYYQQGELNRAADVVAELLRANSSSPTVLFMAWRIHTELAARARDTLAVSAPGSARMHQLMAEHLVNEGDAADAIAQYEKALAKDPSIPGIHYELGEAILQNSTSGASLDRAEHEFKAALAENPKNAGAEAKLGRIAMSRGDVVQARQDYQRALVLEPDQIDALKGMGEIYARRGEAGKALKCLLRASRAAPFDESIDYQLASLYRKLGRAQDASRELAAFKKIRAIKQQTSLAQQRSQQGSRDTRAPQGHP